jgi:lysophospholipase
MGQGLGPIPGSGFPDGETDELLLADGAMAQESMPLFPLLQPSRMVDVIMAVDSVSPCQKL